MKNERQSKLTCGTILIILAIIICIAGWINISNSPDTQYEVPTSDYVEVDGVCLKFTLSHRSYVIDCNSQEWIENRP